MKDGGYLFVHFTDDKEKPEMNEQVYFSISDDGLNWQALNKKEPVLITEIGEKGARDPFIIRGAKNDGFYLIATDLNIYLRHQDWRGASREGSRGILVWKSEDMVHWQGPKLKIIAPETAGCTWAPEAVYDKKNDDYLVFWASPTAEVDYKQRIFCSHTPDFETFSEPRIFLEREKHVIDTDICNDNDYSYRFSKNETKTCIIVEYCSALDGEFKEIDSNLSEVMGVEGPECFRLKDGRWCLFVDEFARGNGYRPYVTDNILSGEFTKVESAFSTQLKLRHGGILPITKEETERLKKAF